MSGTTCRPDSAAFYPVEQTAPWRARHLLAEKTGKFSPENLLDKMPRRAFYPAFQGSALRLHCLTATATPPFQSGLGLMARTPLHRHSQTKQSPVLQRQSNHLSSAGNTTSKTASSLQQHPPNLSLQPPAPL